MKNTLKEFKDFISGGNLVEVAVAFVMALYIQAVINAFVKGIILQIIAGIFDQPDFDNIGFSINDSRVMIGGFISAIINLVIVGAAVFTVVKVITKLKKPAPGEPAKPTEIELLTEIRDSLKK